MTKSLLQAADPHCTQNHNWLDRVGFNSDPLDNIIGHSGDDLPSQSIDRY